MGRYNNYIIEQEEIYNGKDLPLTKKQNRYLKWTQETDTYIKYKKRCCKCFSLIKKNQVLNYPSGKKINYKGKLYKTYFCFKCYTKNKSML